MTEKKELTALAESESLQSMNYKIRKAESPLAPYNPYGFMV